MPYRKWSSAERLEAVALSRTIGAEAAAEQLGMDKRSVRQWAGQAGHGPELAAEPGTWKALLDLALAKTTALVASGKLSPVQISTIAGIAARNAHRDVPTEAGAGTAVEARDRFEDWLIETYLVDEHAPATEAGIDGAMEAIGAVVSRMRRELIRRANDEHPRSRYDIDQPHRIAILAWFSGRTHDGDGSRADPIPAGDVAEWAQGHVRRLVGRYGSVGAALDHAEAVRGRWDRRRWARVSRATEAAYTTHAMQPLPPDDLDALLAEADALLETMQ